MSDEHLCDPKRVEGASLVAEYTNPSPRNTKWIYKDKLGFFGFTSGGEEANMADVPWTYKRQSLERRSVPVRVGDTANPLGSRGDGPIHSKDRGLRCPCGNR